VVAGVVVKLAVLGAQVVQVVAEPVEQGLARKDLQVLPLLPIQGAGAVVAEAVAHHLPDQIPAALEVLEL
jgi:hypothetical protein